MTVATPAEADRLHAILCVRSAWLAERGIPQWQTPYPRALFDADVAQAAVVAVRTATDDLVGTVTVYAARPPYYPLHMPPAPLAKYLCRLAVDLAFRGRGLGREILRWLAADEASRGTRTLRLDVVAANPFLEDYYQAAGYRAILRAKNTFGMPCVFMERAL